MASIGILYICTGHYDVFWRDFVTSCEEHFLRDVEKFYYVFTDAATLWNEGLDGRLSRIKQGKLGWPYDTLHRFHMFNRIEEQLRKHDFLYFFNANCQFMQDISADEFLPSNGQKPLVFVNHPGYFNAKTSKMPYERNPKSLACISMDEGFHYVCGGINGGFAPDYLKMARQLRDNIDKDSSNGIVARWHDESHINRYALDHEHIMLTPAFAYPEGWPLNFDEKIRIRDKKKYGGHNYLRGLPEKKKASKVVKALFRRLMR